MIRAVLCVVLAVALVAVSIPAIDAARRDHTETLVRLELREFTQAARNLLETDDPVRGAGARRIVVLSLPEESWSDAGVDSVTIETGWNGSGGHLTWAVKGGRRQTRRLQDVPIHTVRGDPIVLKSAGKHRLVLTLDGTAAEPFVTVRRFKTDDALTEVHATVASD